MSKIVEKMAEKCENCRQEVKEKKMVMIEMNAVALFPSMTGRRTAKIFRKRIERTDMKMKGLKWKKGLIYIKINKKTINRNGHRVEEIPSPEKIQQRDRARHELEGVKKQGRR